jgi:hypothetical protein
MGSHQNGLETSLRQGHCPLYGGPTQAFKDTRIGITSLMYPGPQIVGSSRYD